MPKIIKPSVTSNQTMCVFTVAQELSLHKIMLLKKFEPFAKSLNIRVVDLKFDPKKWAEVSA